MKRVSFFMGSGFSVPANFPKMRDIDNRIRNSKGVHILKNNSGSVIRTNEYLFYFNIIHKYLEYSLKRISFYSKKIIDLNYEIAYYEINRLIRIMKGDSDELSYQILKEMQTILSIHNDEFEKNDYFIHILDCYCNNISGHVLESINSNTPVYIEKYEAFIRFIKSFYENNVIDSFCTTNYDLVIETLLHNLKLGYNDYFRALSMDDLRDLRDERDMTKIYDPTMLVDNNVPILLKLHGSIDQYPLVEKIGEFLYQKGHVIKSSNINNLVKTLQSNEFFKTSVDPMILIGTKNKLEEYHGYYYSRTFNKFLQCLDKTQILIIIGYGFGDYGINKALWNWLSSQESLKMFIIDMPDTLDIFAKSKQNNGLFHHYHSNERGGKLLYFGGGLEKICFKEISNLIVDI